MHALLLTAIHGMIAWWKQESSGGGGAERAYTLKIRQGCEGGGKGPLVQTELSTTLATHQDQSLIQRAAGFDLGNSGGIGYSEECSPTLMAGASGHKTAVVQKLEDRENET